MLIVLARFCSFSPLTTQVENTVKKLEKLAVRRLPAAFFEEDILDDLIDKSGGNVGDLVHLLYQCCDYIVRNPKKKILAGMTYGPRTRIDAETVKNVVTTLKTETYRLLDSDERSQLRKMNQTHEPGSIKPEYLCLFIKENLILEQRTPDIWFHVHPLLWAAIGIEEELNFDD